MPRAYNFSAGPSMLPEAVMRRAAAELMEYGGTRQSVMEMSHRSPEYMAIYDELKSLFRTVLGIPENYRILFTTGGATAQFAMVPLNLMRTGRADYLLTGLFSKKAAEEAARYGAARAAASGADSGFSAIPATSRADFDPTADYLHICLNNTVYGTRFHTLPDPGGLPLVADASSCLLSGPLDVSRFGLIYAGSQKNLGPAGFTAVIIREDLLGAPRPGTPTLYDYRAYADHDSMLNTPPTYPLYVFGLMLKWLKEEVGGLEAMGDITRQRAALLYGRLDALADFYHPTASPADRSYNNITFRTPSPALDALFTAEAAKAGLLNLKGHRAVGGVRVSLYNGMPMAGAQALADFMADFAAEHR